MPDQAGCVIKGNMDNNGRNRIYYLPGCTQYKFTVVEKDKGEAWFCMQRQAQQTGFVKAKTC
ncbi:hypothetical protein A3B48_02725 [Candidatus Gottesmanbacteria bacterium RIFCSPLOWO2_01_FULL_40_10]|uniref:Uncharacterized protein n=1 Tax=Candidatus Gottesmanbacteria bacterium RIFCSPHIGHO2_01_FULL_40_15 TaxID=1798376 RepID=A0A1F5Z6M0_9BACT|nr:MAG: hypothetical protein A2777_01735 [Candidatus Gottesmanbacteria bacterium RIFCSPHIGHO2_01_FULL_40_15]OGG20770.1 MAG: hypothetical protein A3B48_02725 [Candidatus Gottesmanbacteria bacterium RIFCSPLOWO2_01_FULL_40_10]